MRRRDCGSRSWKGWNDADARSQSPETRAPGAPTGAAGKGGMTQRERAGRKVGAKDAKSMPTRRMPSDAQAGLWESELEGLE